MGGGSGLPEGGAPHQQLVTNADGNAKWEDRIGGYVNEVGKVLIENVTFAPDEFPSEDMNGNPITIYMAYPAPFSVDLSQDRLYDVVCDGVTYELRAEIAEDSLALGDMTMFAELMGMPMSSSSGNHAPLVYVSFGGAEMILMTEGGEHTISIIEYENKYAPIRENQIDRDIINRLLPVIPFGVSAETLKESEDSSIIPVIGEDGAWELKEVDVFPLFNHDDGDILKQLVINKFGKVEWADMPMYDESWDRRDEYDRNTYVIIDNLINFDNGDSRFYGTFERHGTLEVGKLYEAEVCGPAYTFPTGEIFECFIGSNGYPVVGNHKILDPNNDVTSSIDNTSVSFIIEDRQDEDLMYVYMYRSNGMNVTLRHVELLLKHIDTNLLPSSVPVIQTANVGQTVVVKAVDENGKPTEWGCVDVEEELPTPTTEEWTFTLEDGSTVTKKVVMSE